MFYATLQCSGIDPALGFGEPWAREASTRGFLYAKPASNPEHKDLSSITDPPPPWVAARDPGEGTGDTHRSRCACAGGGRWRRHSAALCCGWSLCWNYSSHWWCRWAPAPLPGPALGHPGPHPPAGEGKMQDISLSLLGDCGSSPCTPPIGHLLTSVFLPSRR